MAAILFDLVDNLRTAPQKRDAIEQGASFAFAARLTAADVTGTTAANWHVRLQIRRNVADRALGVAMLDVDSASLGGVTLEVIPGIGAAASTLRAAFHFSATQTGALPIGKWYYDAEVTRLADNDKRRLAEGRVQVKGEVTR